MKQFLTSVLLLFCVYSFSQETFGLKIEPIGIPLGAFQLTGESIINENFSAGIEVTYHNQEVSFLIDDHAVAEAIGGYGRYYFADDAGRGNFLQLYLRYVEHNRIEDGERRYAKDHNIFGADVGFGRQIRWNKISFDPYISAGVLGEKTFYVYQTDDSRQFYPYGLISLDFGYWF